MFAEKSLSALVFKERLLVVCESARQEQTANQDGSAGKAKLSRQDSVISPKT
jgi:hypothetical protein